MLLSTQGAVIERLLRGEFICRTAFEDGWRHLKNVANRDAIQDYLATLNRTLGSVGSGADAEVFFCGYRQIGDDERRLIGGQFKEICQSLSPLVKWLVLVQEALAQDAPLVGGTPVRPSELQSIIEDTPAFREQLAKLARGPFFGSTSDAVDQQLKTVFKRLTERGYLLQPNAEKPIFLGTGKLDYLYEVVRFIDETEALSLEALADSAPRQGALL